MQHTRNTHATHMQHTRRMLLTRGCRGGVVEALRVGAPEACDTIMLHASSADGLVSGLYISSELSSRSSDSLSSGMPRADLCTLHADIHPPTRPPARPPARPFAHADIHTDGRTRMHTYVHACIPISMHKCTHAHTHACAYTHTRACTNTQTHT